MGSSGARHQWQIFSGTASCGRSPTSIPSSVVRGPETRQHRLYVGAWARLLLENLGEQLGRLGFGCLVHLRVVAERQLALLAERGRFGVGKRMHCAGIGDHVEVDLCRLQVVLELYVLRLLDERVVGAVEDESLRLDRPGCGSRRVQAERNVEARDAARSARAALKRDSITCGFFIAERERAPASAGLLAVFPVNVSSWCHVWSVVANLGFELAVARCQMPLLEWRPAYVVDRTPAGPAVPRIDAEPSGASRQMAFGSDLAVGLGRGSLS